MPSRCASQTIVASQSSTTAAMTRRLEGRLGSARSCTPAGSQASSRNAEDDTMSGSAPPKSSNPHSGARQSAGREQRHEHRRGEHEQPPDEQEEPAREAIGPGCDGGRLEQHQYRQGERRHPDEELEGCGTDQPSDRRW